MIKREEIFSFDSLPREHLEQVVFALASHLGLKIFKITNPEYSEGHPDHETFEIEKIEEPRF